MKKRARQVVLVTGSAGLIGSEAVRFFANKGFRVIGIDNDLRKYFFGSQASTLWNLKKIKKDIKQYAHLNIDIRNKKKIDEIFRRTRPDLIIHTAAQPSHDWAAKEPLTDFTVNAMGTHILLESFRKFSPEAVFIFTSTNKVYGDNPNKLPVKELKNRYDVTVTHPFHKGINETMSIDRSMHSIMGVSKTAADLMVQEYGKYFGLKTVSFRCGCLTGPAHSATKLHGFLAYLVTSIVNDQEYTIFGYKGKQVRDNIHAFDVINAFYHFYQNPKLGEVYNLGGSRYSNMSIIEAIEKIEKILGKKTKIKYESKNRTGDHIWYISDISKFKKDYPKWNYLYNSDQILEELCHLALSNKK